MTYSAPQGDATIDTANNLALRNAIGERLQDSIDDSMAMTPHLVSLLKQMRLSDLPVGAR